MNNSENTKEKDAVASAVDAIVMRCSELLDFDEARIVNPLGDKMFFIIGFWKNTKDNRGQWMKNGTPYDFDYLDEKCIASGATEEELIESVKEYKRLSEMSWEEYLLEQTA